MKITKKQFEKLVEQVVADHLRTNPSARLKKALKELEQIRKVLGVNHYEFKQVMKTLIDIQKDVEKLEKRESDAAWRENPGMGMERDI